MERVVSSETSFELSVEILLEAYRNGIFPMSPSRQSREIAWYRPQERGLVPLDSVHLPRRLLRTVFAGQYQITADRAFGEVVSACSASAPGREESWISPVIEGLYEELYHRGYAHSVEVWAREGGGAHILVGGLYGVSLGGAFFGESMFSRQRDTSKIALVHLVAALRKGGYHLLDTQYITPHLSRLGGVVVSSRDYEILLEHALLQQGIWPEDIGLNALQDALHTLKKL